MKERKKKVSSGCRWYLLEAFSWCEVFHVSLSSPSIELFMFRCIIIDCMLTPLGSFSVSGIYEHLLLHHMHRRNFFVFLFYLSLGIPTETAEWKHDRSVRWMMKNKDVTESRPSLTIRMERIFLGINPAEGGEDKVSRKRGIDCRHVKE